MAVRLQGAFAGFCAGTLLLGMNLAVGAAIPFSAAMESVKPGMVQWSPRA